MWCVVSLALAAAPMSLEDALARADAVPAQAAAARAVEARQEGLARLGPLTSNPTVSAQPGLRTEGGPAVPEGQLTLSQGLNLGGLASARRAAAAAELEASRAALQLTRTGRRVAVAEAWLDTWAAQRLQAATQAEVASAQSLVGRLERLAPSGGVTGGELASGRAFAAQAEAFHLAWEGEVVEAGARLALLLGLAEPVTVADAAPALAPLAVDATRAGALPEVRVRALEAAAAARRVDEARAHGATQLQLSLQGGREAPTQWFGNVGVGVTLPVFEHAQRDVARARAEAAQLEGARQQAGAAAQVSLRLLSHELEHTAQVYAVVHGAQAPAALEAARLETRRFEQGEATLLDVVLVRRQALEATVASVRAEVDLLAVRLRAREVLASMGDTP